MNTQLGYRQVGGAWIHPEAKIAEDVTIEPGALVGDGVEIGPGCRIGAGAAIYGPTVLGKDNKIHANAVIGGPPQDVGYAGEPTRLVIGDGNTFREFVTINRATTKESWETRVGSGCYFMAKSHIGHDCRIGNGVILANDVEIAGHCVIGDNVNMAGGVAIVQFSTVGRFAFLGGLSGTTMDCEPFIIHDGMPARPRNINVVGLRRGKVSYDAINKLKEAYRVLFTDSQKGGEDLDAGRAEIERRGALCEEVKELLDFMRRSREGRFGRQSQKPKVKLVPEGERPAEGEKAAH